MLKHLRTSSSKRAVIYAGLLSSFCPQARSAEILIPSYFYPSGTNNGWPQLNAAASQVQVTAILNPASGPGTSVDSNYTSAVNSLRTAGGRVIGYVSTSYTARSAAAVKADILKYATLYNVDGFFLDEMTNTAGATEVAYYADVYAYIKSLNADYRVVGNPGTNSQPAYLTALGTDTLVTFESDAGYSSWSPSPWTSNYAVRRFSNLPYNIPDVAGMTAAVNAAVSKRVGYVYVTDDSGANPWDRLPTYWASEISALRAVTPTWTSAASGSWHQASNWTTAQIPNGEGAEAVLLGAIAAPRTIYADVPVTLGTLVLGNANRYVLTGTASLTMDAAVESPLIDVRKGSHTINLPLTLAETTTVFIQSGAALTIADPLTIQAGAALVKKGGGFLSITSTIEGDPPLVIQGGTVMLQAPARLDTLRVESGALQLGAASLTLGSIATEEARALLLRGIEGGISSPLIDAKHRIAYSTTTPGTRFELGVTGDATLDGVVDFADLLVLASYANAVDCGWVDGDFTYDGLADSADLLALRTNYLDSDHTGSFESDWALAQAMAPEPLALPLTLFATCRRRRV